MRTKINSKFLFNLVCKNTFMNFRLGSQISKTYSK